MSAWHSDLGQGGDFIKLPVGAEVEVTVKAVKKVSKPDFNLKKKDGTDLGYYWEFETDKGILTVNTFALAFALRDAGVEPGYKAKISHTGMGKYEIGAVLKVATEGEGLPLPDPEYPQQ